MIMNGPSRLYRRGLALGSWRETSRELSTRYIVRVVDMQAEFDVYNAGERTLERIDLFTVVERYPGLPSTTMRGNFSST